MAVGASVSVASMDEREEPREGERDDSVPDRVTAGRSTDEDDDEKKDEDKKDKDDTVDHASEQSMDASDPPAW